MLSRFALHYNLNDGRCDPANALVALELGTSKREVRKALSIGESHGWVEREERHGKHGGPQSNIVHLTYPAEIRAMMSGESERTKIASERTNESPQRGQMSPPNREVEQRSIEHSVLTYGIAERDASFQGIYESIFGQEGSEAKSGPSGRERNGTSPRRERSDPGKPYTSDDVELVSAALNDGDKTYAGIVKATEQPGAIGDGVGIERNLLRRVLDDCMRVGLIGTERRNGKDYFWMTEYACGVPDWMDVL